MSGDELAKLFDRYKKCQVLSDSELKSLLGGLTFLRTFNCEMGFTPEAVYYGTEAESIKRIIEAESIKRIIEARKQDK